MPVRGPLLSVLSTCAGNWRCPICGTWASEVCEHINEGGNLKLELHEQARKLHEEERMAEQSDQWVRR